MDGAAARAILAGMKRAPELTRLSRDHHQALEVARRLRRAEPETLDDAGLLVPPGDPVALAVALERLAADEGLRLTLGKRARRRAEERFAHEDHARALAELYRGLVAGARADG